MNGKLKNLYIILGTASFALASILSVSYAQSSNADGRFQSAKVNKSRSVTQSWEGKVTVRVVGMKNVDAVNIRPTKDAQLNVKVLSISEQEIVLPDGRKLRVPKNGDSISEDRLSLSESEISFVRPEIEGKVLVDIELPELVQIDLFFNDEEVIQSAKLYSPLVIRDKKVERGQENSAKALTRLIFPQLRNRKPDDVVETSDNKLFVPFSKLQLKKSDELPDATPIKAMIEINNRGIVEKVTMIEPLNSQEIEQKLLQWEFVPYKKGEAGVNISTLFLKN